MAHYIREDNEHLNESAYYGPFDESELDDRLNDSFADFMAEGGAEISSFEMSDEEAAKYYVNPREFWMSQIAALEDH